MGNSSATLSRKEREKAQHRQDIIEAAMRLFSEHGFHSVSMQQIAAEAEFATGTLYKFFPGKRDLFRTIMIGVITEIADEIMPVFDQDVDELTLIKSYFTARRLAFSKRVEYIRLYNMVADGFGDSGDEEVDAYLTMRRDRGKERLAKLFERGMEKGVFKTVKVELLVHMFDEFCQAVVRSECTLDDFSEDDVTDVLSLFLNGILA